MPQPVVDTDSIAMAAPSTHVETPHAIKQAVQAQTTKRTAQPADHTPVQPPVQPEIKHGMIHTVSQQPTSSVDNHIQPQLPDAAVQSYTNALAYVSTLNTAQHPVPDLQVERVNQLDAIALDTELNLILASTYKRMFKYFDWYNVFSTCQYELNAALQYLIYRYTVLRDAPTPANKLQNLILRSEVDNHISTPSADINISKQLQLYALSPLQKRYYVLLNVVVPYVWHRIRHYMTMSAYGGYAVGTFERTAYNVYNAADALYNTATLFNLITFLYNSHYSTVADRLLKLRYVYIRARVNRQISFDFMNQQLAWQTLIEFIMYVYPFITSTIHAIHLKSYLSNIAILNTNSYSINHAEQQYTMQTTCPICSAQPCNIPYQASCSCIYCYYCLASHKLANSRMVCNRCNRVITSYQPYKVTNRIDSND